MTMKQENFEGGEQLAREEERRSDEGEYDWNAL
jgi:hypothetical protein